MLCFCFEKKTKTVVKSNPDTDTDVVSGGEGNEIDLDRPGKEPATGKPASPIDSNTPNGNDVFIMDKSDDRTASFFAQPGILAGTIILVISFTYLF